MAIEDLDLLPLSHEESTWETLSDMREQYYQFEMVGLEGLFAYFERGKYEI